MDEPAEGAPETRRRGRTEGREPRRKGPKKDGATEVRRLKRTILLAADTDLRLTVHAAYMGLERSQLVEQLIAEHCRRFVVSERGKSAHEGGSTA